MIDWSGFVELVRKHQRFVLTAHIRPDCDCLGSELALAAVLTHMGKDVQIVNAFAVPPNYRFLDPDGRMKQLGAQVPPDQIEACEVLIVLDTSAWAQLGPMGEVIKTTRLKKVVIDHHVSGDDLGAVMLKDTDAEATGRLVVDACDALGVPMSAQIAVPAYVALATDTGWFRFSSTTYRTLQLAARLVEAGAVPAAIYKELYENETLARLRLMGRAMGRVQSELDGRLVYTWLEHADFEACGALPSDSEDLINLTLSVGGTQAAVILVEQKTGGFKISFRSRCDLDCARLAEQFGGGGHKKAAGAFLAGTLESARTRTLDAVRAAMK
jgi:bifunctional oligoribonuclease and PAP phosphatase NrnA